MAAKLDKQYKLYLLEVAQNPFTILAWREYCKQEQLTLNEYIWLGYVNLLSRGT
jgi:hypothetical protein